MSSSRYERVPQLVDDSISLAAVPADASYNYNSGVPSSPPPSFRSRTSSDVDFNTVRLTPRSSERTVTRDERSRDSNATIVEGTEDLIRNLNARIERLEESIGRLLLDKENNETNQGSGSGGRCCVTFVESDNLRDVENQILHSRHDSCVTIQPRQTSAERILKLLVGAAITILAMVIVWTLLLAYAHRNVKKD